MITEITLIDVREGEEDAFVAAFRDKARDLLVTTPGCRGTRMLRSQETPTRFVAVTEWDSIAHHLENFQSTDRFTHFRTVLEPYLAGPPHVDHLDEV